MTGTLTGQGLSALLALFDHDPAQAAERYEALRARLVRFFAWKGVFEAEDCADETIDRVARRLEEGEEIRTGDPVRYFHGVARNVLREHWARVEREARHRALWPRDACAPSRAVDAAEECLQRCLDALPPAERGLVLEYYEGTGARRIARRQAMAARLGLSLGGLRVRMHRLRLRLEDCASRCLGPETFGPPGPQGDEDRGGHD